MGGKRGRILVLVSACVVFAVLVLLLWSVSTRTAQAPAAEEEEASPTMASAAPSASPDAEEDEYVEARERLVRNLRELRGISDAEVLTAMRSVPRHEFVLEKYLGRAYDDHALPIDYGQTISQPFVVALMTELLELERGDKVLEIGTGSGYQAAMLAELADQVYTVEIIPELADSASARLRRLGYDNIRASNHDGYYGWEEHAPYDVIIVTAAPDHVPQPLIKQLKDGGRLVIPVGPVGWYQTLWLITKEGGEVEFHNKGGVQFVPLTGEH